MGDARHHALRPQQRGHDRDHDGATNLEEFLRSLMAGSLASAYDASDVTFRVLRAFGWGPLLNLGYYPFGKPLTLLNFLATPLRNVLEKAIHWPSCDHSGPVLRSLPSVSIVAVPASRSK